MKNIGELLQQVEKDFIKKTKQKSSMSISYTRNYNEFAENKEISKFYNELKTKRLIQGYKYYILYQTDNDFTLEIFA